MYKVGILGTENSHANFFAKTFNLAQADGKFAYPDFKVTALYALEKAPSEQICKEVGDIKICDSIEEMIGLVDCVMVTARHGKYHLPFALPFIQKGMHCFIDKPFTCDIAETHTLLAAAKENGVHITGGSACKYIPALQEIKKEIEAGTIGKVCSAVFNFPVDLGSEHGGLYFYASHLSEMVMALFGFGIQSVVALQKNGHLTAIARYEGVDVVLTFAKSPKYLGIVYGEKGVINRELPMDGVFDAEARHFVEIVRGENNGMTDEELAAPVRFMNAIEKSLALGGKEVALAAL